MRCCAISCITISIHALLAESDNNVMPAYAACGISIHALLAESDTLSFNGLLAGYPISIHALLAESDSRAQALSVTGSISIHALLAESDWRFPPDTGAQEVFLSTLSLRRATLIFTARHPAVGVFLSTLSLRRATTRRCLRLSFFPHFYPRSPCGERLRLFAPSGVDFAISIHALLAESDTVMASPLMSSLYFYPRSPCGERRHPKTSDHPHNTISIHALLAESDNSLTPARISSRLISIHALLAESDNFRCPFKRAICNFYPRSPCGERLIDSSRAANCQQHFYPRSPCGERQRAEIHANSQQEFLSTLSLRRATAGAGIVGNTDVNFYPRSPCGERRLKMLSRQCRSRFLSTLSLRRATTQLQQAITAEQISIHALLAESDAPPCKGPWACFRFLSTLSLRRATPVKRVTPLTIPSFLSTLSLRRATITLIALSTQQIRFLSTLSLRRATVASVLEAGGS